MKEHVASFSRMYVDLRVECLSTLAIPNGPEVSLSSSKWIRKLIDPSMPCQIVLEATGVYHETLACFLTGEGLAGERSTSQPGKVLFQDTYSKDGQ